MFPWFVIPLGPGRLGTIRTFLRTAPGNADEARADVMSLLADSYTGLPVICNILLSWREQLGIATPARITEDAAAAVGNVLIARGDAAKFDASLLRAEPAWVKHLIEFQEPAVAAAAAAAAASGSRPAPAASPSAQAWRRTFATLCRTHPNSVMLSSFVAPLLDQATASADVPVLPPHASAESFDAAFSELAHRVVHTEDGEVHARLLAALGKMACLHEPAYVHAHRRLQQWGAPPSPLAPAWQRLAHDLATHARSVWRADACLRLDLLLVGDVLGGATPGLAVTLPVVLRQEPPRFTTADVAKLYVEYRPVEQRWLAPAATAQSAAAAAAVPPVSRLRAVPRLFPLLLQSLADGGPLTQAYRADAEMLHRHVALLALAVCVPDEWDVPPPEVRRHHSQVNNHHNHTPKQSIF